MPVASEKLPREENQLDIREHIIAMQTEINDRQLEVICITLPCFKLQFRSNTVIKM